MKLKPLLRTLEQAENILQCFGGMKEYEGSAEEIWEGAAGVVALGNKSKVHMLLHLVVFTELIFLWDCEGLCSRLSLALLL